MTDMWKKRKAIIFSQCRPLASSRVPSFSLLSLSWNSSAKTTNSIFILGSWTDSYLLHSPPCHSPFNQFSCSKSRPQSPSTWPRPAGVITGTGLIGAWTESTTAAGRFPWTRTWSPLSRPRLLRAPAFGRAAQLRLVAGLPQAQRTTVEASSWFWFLMLLTDRKFP